LIKQLLILLFLCNQSKAFTNQSRFYVNAQLGSHIQRIGIGLLLQNQIGNIHLNANSILFYNHQYYGGTTRKISNTTDIAMLWSSTKKQETVYHNYYTMNSLQTLLPFQSSIGYQMRWYIMPKHSSQRTASIFMQYKKAYIQSENDAFAFSSLDRFRTGNIVLGFVKDSFHLAMAIQLFTGETRNATTKIIDGKCYKILSATKLGKHSNGILQIQLGAIAFGQQWRTAVGWDSEHIRHYFQNKLVHNQLLKKLNPHITHCTIPMLQPNGAPCLQASDPPKKSKLYFQLSANDNNVY
jgi:hypothetical protein